MSTAQREELQLKVIVVEIIDTRIGLSATALGFSRHLQGKLVAIKVKVFPLRVRYKAACLLMLALIRAVT